eukprot:scaffold6226_cov228-Pinguiococcus_pyrenoidosus.AAC.3
MAQQLSCVTSAPRCRFLWRRNRNNPDCGAWASKSHTKRRLAASIVASRSAPSPTGSASSKRPWRHSRSCAGPKMLCPRLRKPKMDTSPVADATTTLRASGTNPTLETASSST